MSLSGKICFDPDTFFFHISQTLTGYFFLDDVQFVINGEISIYIFHGEPALKIYRLNL